LVNIINAVANECVDMGSLYEYNRNSALEPANYFNTKLQQ